MSNWLKNSLASTMLAAALGATATAEAGDYRQNLQQQQNDLFESCYTVGQQKGVAPLPLTGKAYQQDRNAGVGCTFATAAGNEFIVENAFDLKTQRGAQGYTRAINTLQRAEDTAQRRLMTQQGRIDQNGNVISDTANQTRKTVDSVNNTANSIDRTLKTIDRGAKTIEKLFK